MSDILVTVILPTYNRREFLPKALDDLKNQTYKDWRCLVINDGGESVADIVRAADDTRIELHEREHLGKPTQLNWALDQVTTKYVTYLDDDDDVYPFHLETLVNAALKSGKSLVSSRMTTTWLGPDGKAFRTDPASDSPIDYERLRYCHNTCGAAQYTILHTLDLARRAGPYDTRMKILIDYDFIKRLVALEEPYVVERVTIDHLMRPKFNADGTLASISGLWQRDPEAAGRSLLAFFEKDPSALTRLYLDAASKTRLERILASKAWKLIQALRKLRHPFRKCS